MKHKFVPTRLFTAIVGRHRGEQLVEFAKAAGARGATLAFGHTVGQNRLLAALSLADIQHDIIFIAMGGESEKVLEAVKLAARSQPKKYEGLGLVTAVSSEGEKKAMPSEYKLITVIINQGYAEEVMAEARKAGATGGTILTARGTGTEDDVKFFGLSLVPEKEMLLIVAQTEKYPQIIQAVNNLPSLSEPGLGIVYTQEVEDFFTLGKAS